MARLQLLPGQDNTAALEELLAQVRGEARPSLILLENLQHAPQLEPLLQELAGDPALPHIVAMLVQQAGVQHTELQLRCSFRWCIRLPQLFPGRSITRKGHVLSFHVPETLQKYKTFYLFHKMEQTGESVHKLFNRLTSKFMPMKPPQERLWKVIIEFESKQGLQTDLLLPIKKEKV